MSYHSEDIPLILKHYDALNCRTWPFYVIEMPLTAEGQGPASIKEADSVTYEVWDHFCNSHGSHKYLPDAINQALQLTLELLHDSTKNY